MAFFKHLQWGIEYAAYRGVDFALNRFSLARVHRIGGGIGALAYHLFPARRRIVMRNLRIAFGETHSLGELELLARCVFRHTGANLFSSLRSPTLSGKQLEDALEIRNLDMLHQLIAEGKGVILLSPHMGNWELLAQLIYFLPEGAKLGTHYRPLNNPHVNKLVEAQRSQRGTRLFAKKDSPLAMSAFLRDGGTLGILADQRAGAIGQCCSYYGRYTSCSPFPEILAKRTGAALVSISLQSLSAGRWRCTLQHVTESNTPGCMNAMEQATRRSPGDVFWFQDRWRINKATPFSLPGKPYKGSEPATSGKPVRLLIWIEPGQTGIPPLPAGTRPDLTLELACPAGTEAPQLGGDRIWDHIWATDPSVPEAQLPPVLTRIDEARPLPLDAIVVVRSSRHLQRAARSTGIPVTRFPSNQKPDSGGQNPD
jgi:KDO2-lipid IV(A) lauroyltransferase